MSLGNKLERFFRQVFQAQFIANKYEYRLERSASSKRTSFFASFSLKEMKNKLKHLFLVSL